MEPVLIDAYRTMLTTRGCSVDRILEDPRLRSEFLTLVYAALPDFSEADILHGLNNLRKQRKLPRRSDVSISPA
jgi:hypothetical protein